MRYYLFPILVIGIIIYLANSYQEKRKDNYVEYANDRVDAYNDAASQIEELTQMVRDSIVDTNNRLKLTVNDEMNKFFVNKIGNIVDLKCFLHPNNKYYKDSSNEGINLICNIWGDKYSVVFQPHYEASKDELTVVIPMSLRKNSNGEYKQFDSKGFCKASRFFVCGLRVNDKYIPPNIIKPKEIDSTRFKRLLLIDEPKFGTITFKERPKLKQVQSVNELGSNSLRDCEYEGN